MAVDKVTILFSKEEWEALEKDTKNTIVNVIKTQYGFDIKENKTKE